MAQWEKGSQAVATADVAALAQEGVRLLAAKEYEKAETLFFRAVEQEPNKLSHHYHLGRALLRQNRLDDAGRCFNTIISLNSESHLGLYGKAQVAEAQKKWDEAIEGYQNLIAMQPKWIASVYADLGKVLSRMHRWQESIECYRHLVQTDPASLMYHQSLADTLFDACRYLGAIESYKKVLELNSDCFWPHYQLGKAFFKVDKFEEAALSFETAYSVDKNRFNCYEIAALSCEFTGRRELAVECWQSFIESKKNSFLSTIVRKEEEDIKKDSMEKDNRIKDLTREKDKLVQENELLLLQLYQTQEKSESCFLKSQMQKQIIEEQEEIVQSHNELRTVLENYLSR